MELRLKRRDGTVRALALIDDEDAALVDGHSWHLSGPGYAAAKIKGKEVYLHRLLTGATKGQEVDHINRDRLDNRRANLRLVDHLTNMQNTGSRDGSTSRYRGVSWHKERRKWVVYVKVAGVQHYCGLFEDEDEAAAVAVAARERLHRG